MVSVQNMWQQYQFQCGMCFGFDETLKQITHRLASETNMKRNETKNIKK